MKHILRLNVYKKGYTLFSSQPPKYIREHSLDIPSQDIPKNYISAQMRIDNMLRTKISRLFICITNLNGKEHPVVAYGRMLPIKDDNERNGIKFIHAIEIGDNLSIDEAIICIAQQSIEEINDVLARLTSGDVSPENAIENITKKFSKPFRRKIPLPFTNGGPIKEIKNDCMPIIAWLAMAISHNGVAPPWEIYEEYSQHSGLVSTISSHVDAHEVISVSDYLYQSFQYKAIADYLVNLRLQSKENIIYQNVIQKQRIREIPNDESIFNNETSNSGIQKFQDENKTAQSTEGETNDIKNSIESNLINHNKSVQSDKTKIIGYIPHSREVWIENIDENNLLLTDGTNKYDINNKNIDSLKGPNCYEFVIIKSGWSIREFRLVLPIEKISSLQKKELDHFCENLMAFKSHQTK
jgi:hypothetical protein